MVGQEKLVSRGFCGERRAETERSEAESGEWW